MLGLLASIPSPSTNHLEIGPLRFNFYGIAIALGVIAAILLASRRFERRGGDGRLLERAAIWGVAAGVVGARIGYLITHSGDFTDDPIRILYVWEGGLALYGGLIAGTAVVLWIMRRHGANLLDVMDSTAPAIPLAQVIGRFGNYFNQELYGRPTELPWALEIDPEYRVPGFEQYETFHPTFAYEQILNLALIGFILWIDRRRVLPRGALFLVYTLGYSIIRFLLELVRIDTTYRFAGVSRNGWVSLLVAVASAVALVVWFRRVEEKAPLPPAPSPAAEAE